MSPNSNDPSLAQQAENLKNDVVGAVNEQKDNAGIDRSALQQTKDFIGVDKSKYQEANDKLGTEEKSLAQKAADLMSSTENKTKSSD